MAAHSPSSSGRGRFRWLSRQLLVGVLLLLGFATLVFFVVNVAIPYDYATQFAIGSGDEPVREQLGLDRPLVARWLTFMAGLLTGDLGTSYTGASVTDVLWQRLPVTLLIFVVGGVVAYLLGGWLGRLAGWHRSRILTGGATSFGVVFYTLFPPFLVFLLSYFLASAIGGLRIALGLPVDSLRVWQASAWDQRTVLLLVTGSLLVAVVITALVSGRARRYGIRWLPAPLVLAVTLALAVASWHVFGFATEGTDLMLSFGGRAGAGSPLMAVVAFLLLAFGEVMLLMRVGVESELGEQYIQTATAKGLSQRQVRDRHVGRVASIPALTRAVTSLPYLLTGMIIIEWELQVAGLSNALFGAVINADIPMIVGTLVGVGLVTIVLRILMDLVHAGIDPRVGQADR